MKRQILQFAGTPSVAGYPKLDVSESEIAVANIESLVYWPGLFEWDVSEGKILDRMSDLVCPTYGASAPGDRFVTQANGKRAYKPASINDTLVFPGFDTSKSFTVGLVAGAGFAIGSIQDAAAVSSTPAPWMVISSPVADATYGKPWVVFGPVTSGGYAQYPGAGLTDAALSAVVLIVDRIKKTIVLRVNGVVTWSYSGAAVASTVIFSGLNVGVTKYAGQPIGTRLGAIPAVAAFTSALAGDDLAALETMLMTAAAA